MGGGLIMAQAASAQSRKSTKYTRAVSSASDTHVALNPAQRVTAQISALLERGVRPWIRPWDDIAAPDALVLPLRSWGTPYRGMNVIALWAATLETGFKARHWFTFKQASAMKACVRKGERGSYVVYYTELTSKAGEGAVPSPDDTSETRRILRGYTVFNADQIDGLPLDFYAKPDAEPLPASPITKTADEARLSALFAAVPVIIRHGGNRALYSKSADIIQMPLREAFRDNSQYWATLAHELSHNAASRIMPHGFYRSCFYRGQPRGISA
jgi:antirestriction protein ArdC